MGMHHAVTLCLLIVTIIPYASAGPSNARLLSRLQAAAAGQGESCQPWSVPPADQCSYIKDHAAICYPDGGFQAYLAVHYCFFGPAWSWLSLLVLLAAAVLAFAVLLTVSERFFCPALELISDYLKLPPVVAGATLLSFGNGAPDTFTQVAAVGQGGGHAVGMALAEPLGGGLFASNVVFGLVVLIASKQQAVIQKCSFLKDVCFYLASLVIIAFMLADGKVTPVEAGVMCGMYVLYVCTTFYTSRADEPLHADVALHEFPPKDGGIDAPDSSSEDFNYESEPEQCEYIDATTSIRDFDLEAPPSEQGHSLRSSSPTDSELSNSPDKALNPGLQHRSAGSTAAPCASSGGGSRTLQALLSWRHRGGQHGLKEPLLLAIDESPAQSKDGQEAGANSSYEVDSGGDTVRDSSVWTQTDATIAREPQGASDVDAVDADASTGSQPQQQPQQQRHVKVQPRGSAGGAASDLPPPAFAHLEPTTSSPAGLHTTHAAPRMSPASRGFMAHGRRSFTEGVKLSVPTYSHRGSHTTSPTPPDRADGAGQVWSPRAASESGYCFNCGGTNSPHLPRITLPPAAVAAAVGALSSVGSLTPTRRCTSDGTWLQGDPLGSGTLSPHLQQLQEQHFAEQVELLEQQAAEHDALLAEHQEQQEALKAGGMSTKHKLQYPFVQLLSCTMPRVGTGSGHRYQRWRACLLPLTVPLLWFVAAPSMLLDVGWRGLVLGGASAAVGSCIIWATYPASAVPRTALKGVFAVLAFVQAIVWLNISASALVQVCVVVGVIFGLQPALLGATVLAWGNSVPDLINNLAMAQDGFPSMAVAACFASPLFTLLIGMGGALAYGTTLHGGPLSVPVDGPLMVMAGFSIANMLQHLLVVPCVHKYKMKPSLAVITFLFYACFNVVYVLATVGIIRVRGLVPAS